MEQEQESSLFELNIDQQTTGTLRSASQWGRVLAVLGFILGTLMLLFGFIMYSNLTASYRGAYQGSVVMRTLATRYLIICILFAAVLMTGAVFILNFSNKTMTALNTSDQFLLNSGLSAIKSGIIFWSVIFIIFIVLMLLAFIGFSSV